VERGLARAGRRWCGGERGRRRRRWTQKAQPASITALRSLQQLATMDVENDPHLPACQATQVFQGAGGQQLYQAGNDDAGAYP